MEQHLSTTARSNRAGQMGFMRVHSLLPFISRRPRRPSHCALTDDIPRNPSRETQPELLMERRPRAFERRLARVLQRSDVVDVALLLQQEAACDSFEQLYLSKFQSRLAKCLAKHNQQPLPAERSRTFVVPATPLHKLEVRRLILIRFKSFFC